MITLNIQQLVSDCLLSCDFFLALNLPCFVLTWSLKGQEFGRNWVLRTQGDQVEILDMSVVISYNTKTTTTAKIGVERDIGNFFFFCCRMETNQTQFLEYKSKVEKFNLQHTSK